MFKSTTKRFAALLLAVLIFAGTYAVIGVEGAPSVGMATLSADGPIDFVSRYLEERGLTRDDLGLNEAPPHIPANDGTVAPSLPRPISISGGFAPSTRFPHSTIRANIQSHANINRDVVAWLTIPNSNINVPVVIRNTDNSFYLYRDWRGNNYAGSLTWRNWAQFPDTATYLDFRTNLGSTWATSSRNMSIYGHNWNNLRPPFRIGNNAQDRMFAQLKSYTSINFATQNPHIYFSTGNMEGIWRVFAVGYAHTTPFFFYNNPNPSVAGLDALINEWRARSHINFNVDVNSSDRILTLTTCTRFHGETDTQRFVVVARLLRPGESESDVVTAVANPNIRHPDFTQPTRLPPSTTTAAPATPPLPTITTPSGGEPPQTLFGE